MTKQQNCPQSNYITLLISPSHTVFPDMAGEESIPINHTVIIEPFTKNQSIMSSK